jgi:endonuclease/exonuclease/phosphatase family metal-dependent hydrolase
MKRLNFISGLILISSSINVLAVEVGVASFNLAWAGAQSDFENHVRVCSDPSVNWCDTRAKTKKGSDNPSAEEDVRAKKCQLAFDTAAGGAIESMMVAPCNAYDVNNVTSADSKIYFEKLQGLTNTIDKLITDHSVDILAFQEVKSVEVIRLILGKHSSEFDVCIAQHSTFQTLGFAWRKGLSVSPGKCNIEPSLSIKEDLNSEEPARRLRPGLELKLDIAGNKVAILNVHLKSACANLKTQGNFQGRELTDSNKSCQILNRQIVPLENWIERAVLESPFLVILGDFNRRLDEEFLSEISRNKIRLDGSDPASKNTLGAEGQVTSRLLWQEISDGNPELMQVPLSRTDANCKGFIGLDHILLNSKLAAKQAIGITSMKIPVDEINGQKIKTSDHCPRIVKLLF